LFALYNTEPELASWENATRLAERTAVQNKLPGSRSSLRANLSRFKSVAHLWGAWCIRERRFGACPAQGYDGWQDFQFFLMEAEILREWGQKWCAPRAKAEPPLPEEVWRVPDVWTPPKREPDWPGRVPQVTVPDDMLASLRKAGRPRKSR